MVRMEIRSDQRKSKRENGGKIGPKLTACHAADGKKSKCVNTHRELMALHFIRMKQFRLFLQNSEKLIGRSRGPWT